MQVTSSGTGIPVVHVSPADANDARLVSRVADGDRQAFDLLYRGYFPRLTRFLNRMTRSVPLIEEIVNDTMLVVWQKAHRYNAGSKVSTWVFAIAYRKACKGIKMADEPVDSDPDQREADVACEPDHELDRSQLRRVVGDALAALPIEQRTVVHLAYHHDMAYADIAEIMDCPVNTVKTRMFHARRRLKLLLADQQEDPP